MNKFIKKIIFIFLIFVFIFFGVFWLFLDKNVIWRFFFDVIVCGEFGLKLGDNLLFLYDDDILDVFDFVKVNEFVIKKELNINNGGRLEVLVIVFFEIIRWNFF